MVPKGPCKQGETTILQGSNQSTSSWRIEMVCHLTIKRLGSQKGLFGSCLAVLAGNSATMCSNMSAALSSQNWNIKIQTNITFCCSKIRLMAPWRLPITPNFLLSVVPISSYQQLLLRGCNIRRITTCCKQETRCGICESRQYWKTSNAIIYLDSHSKEALSLFHTSRPQLCECGDVVSPSLCFSRMIL